MNLVFFIIISGCKKNGKIYQQFDASHGVEGVKLACNV